MQSLETMLNSRTHRDLELIARSHGVPFTRREPKSVGLAKLHHALVQGRYQRAFKTLTPAHHAALRALVAAEGALPLTLFTHHFGQIRLYKPWRDDRPARHPWRQPLSIAERLYHLGYIAIQDGDWVVIIEEAAAWLPARTQPQGQKMTASIPQFTGRMALLRDVAALLGMLLYLDVAPVHERWLPLSAMRYLNTCLEVTDDSVTYARSEHQTGRVRWLHYVALTSGLVSVQAGLLKPTVAAWQWLAASPQVQWDCLMHAITHDLEDDHSTWDMFRFPSITGQAWVLLRQTLDVLPESQAYRVKDVLSQLDPYLLPDARDSLAYVIRDVLAWCGIGFVVHGRIFVNVVGFSSQTTPIKDIYHLPLPHAPSVALVHLLAFAPVVDGIATINETAIQNAITHGFSVDDICQILTTLSGLELPEDVRQNIAAWAQTAQSLTLRSVIVLNAADAQVAERIRVDWRLAGHIVGQLSPHNFIIDAQDAETFIARLKRRHYPVTSYLRPSGTGQVATASLPQDIVAYLLLAVRTYQKIHATLDKATYIPKSVTHWLMSQVDASHSDFISHIEAHADQIVSQLRPQSIDAVAVTPEAIRQRVTTAYHQHQPLMMDYQGLYAEAPTTRIIIIDDIYEVGNFTYIDAFCQTVGKILTFRLDRIRHIHASVPSAQSMAS